MQRGKLSLDPRSPNARLELIRMEHPGEFLFPNPARSFRNVTRVVSFRSHNN